MLTMEIVTDTGRLQVGKSAVVIDDGCRRRHGSDKFL